MQDELLLRVRDLRLQVQEGEELVHDVSFELKRGESLALVGGSGSGKSMTALALLGLLPDGVVQTGGSIELASSAPLQELSEKDWRRVRGARIGLVFQDPASALNPVLRIGTQVEEVLEAHQSLSREQRRARVVELLHEVQLADAEQLLQRYPHELSGGQRQRVMLAIALAGEPELLLADEPTTALDVTVQAAILELVARIQRERGLAMLWISHDLGVVAQVSDRVLVMEEGCLVEEGPVDQVLRAPQSTAARALVAAAPQARGARAAAGEATTDTIPTLLVRDLTVRYPAERDWLGRVRRWTTAVDHVSMRIEAGSTMALVGESGSGKSSLGRAVLRLVESSGEVLLGLPAEADGHRQVQLSDLSGSALRAARRQLGVVFQDPARSLNPRRRVGASVVEPLQIHRTTPRSALRARAQELFERVELDPAWVDRFPDELSGGQKQRVAIARAIALDPALLICDEAVSALDVVVQARILNLLQGLQEQTGLSMLFITHDLAVVEGFADQVAVMRAGKLVECGSVAEVFAAPQHAYTQALLSASPRLPDGMLSA